MTLKQLKISGARQLAIFKKLYEARRRAIIRAQKEHIQARLRSKKPNNSFTLNSFVRSSKVKNLLYRPLINQWSYRGKL